MKTIKSLILLCLILFCTISSGMAQIFKKGCSKCEAVELFLNDPKVIDNFSRFNKAVIDTFVIVDMDSTLTKCKVWTWRGKPVRLLLSGNLFDSVMNYSWPYLNVDKRKLYKFSMVRYNLFFMQGHGSLISQARYKIKKGQYFVDAINNSVE